MILFDEDTPIELIRAIRPDVLIKGADYSPDQVVGSEFVVGYGGKLVLVGFVSGESTSGRHRENGDTIEAGNRSHN